MSRSWAVAATAAVIFVSTAEAGGSTEPVAVVVDSHVHSGERDGHDLFVLSPLIVARLNLRPELELDAGWAFAAIHQRGAGTTFQAGNPFVSLGRPMTFGALTLRPAAAFAVPATLLTADSPVSRAGLLRAAAMRGNNGFGLFAPGMISLVPMLDARWDLSRRWWVAAQVQTAFSAQFTRMDGLVRGDVAFQGMGAFGVVPLEGIDLGLRVHANYVPTLPRELDPTQAAATPFVRVAGKTGFFEGRATLNLDAPLGPAWTPGGVWSAGLAVGAIL